MKKAFRSIIWVCVIFAVANCTSTRYPMPTYDPNSRIVLINTLEPVAYYHSFKLFSESSHEYNVNWGIPDFVEKTLRSGTTNPLIRHQAPNWMVGISSGDIRPAIRSDKSSQIKSEVINACKAHGADGIFIMSSSLERFSDRHRAKGYGLYTYHGGLARSYFAYAVLDANFINCFPLYWYNSRSTVTDYRIEGMEVSTEVEKLTIADLALADSELHIALTTSEKRGVDPVLEQWAKVMGSFFGK